MVILYGCMSGLNMMNFYLAGDSEKQITNFSKVSCIVILCCKFSSKLTFENFYPAGNKEGQDRAFAKVCFTVILHCRFCSVLILRIFSILPFFRKSLPYSDLLQQILWCADF